jgi:hypothetical protein
VGALASGVVGDAGLFGKGGHVHAPALFQLVVEVAQLERRLLVGNVEVVEGGDVGLPLGALGFRDARGIGGELADGARGGWIVDDAHRENSISHSKKGHYCIFVLWQRREVA